MMLTLQSGAGIFGRHLIKVLIRWLCPTTTENSLVPLPTPCTRSRGLSLSQGWHQSCARPGYKFPPTSLLDHPGHLCPAGPILGTLSTDECAVPGWIQPDVEKTIRGVQAAMGVS